MTDSELGSRKRNLASQLYCHCKTHNCLLCSCKLTLTNHQRNRLVSQHTGRVMRHATKIECLLHYLHRAAASACCMNTPLGNICFHYLRRRNVTPDVWMWGQVLRGADSFLPRNQCFFFLTSNAHLPSRMSVWFSIL